MNDAINSRTLNDPAPQSMARQPRAIVQINGMNAQGVIEWEVDNNIHYLADAFRVELSLSAQPTHMNWQWWATEPVLTVQVFVGFTKDPGNFKHEELMSLIIGNVDEIDIEPTADKIVLMGRDLTARFVDIQTTETWKNMFAATGDINRPGIVETLAKEHGMQFESYQTSDKVGGYYKYDHVKPSNQHSEWDLLTYLANKEGAEVFVRGNTLVFRQPPTTPGDPYVIQWAEADQISASPRSNAKRFHLSSNRTLARDVIVHVRSWSQSQKAGFTKTAKATHKRISRISPRAIPDGTAQTYFRTFPNLTPKEAQKRADTILAEITSHERRIRADLPGDNLLSVDNPVQIRGTGTDFDDFYFAQSVVRSFSFEDGYRMTLEAKNHPVESEVAL